MSHKAAQVSCVNELSYSLSKMLHICSSAHLFSETCNTPVILGLKESLKKLLDDQKSWTSSRNAHLYYSIVQYGAQADLVKYFAGTRDTHFFINSMSTSKIFKHPFKGIRIKVRV